MIINGIAVPVIVSIIVSILFTTSVHIDVLFSSLKIQYTILRATTHAICLIVFDVDVDVDVDIIVSITVALNVVYSMLVAMGVLLSLLLVLSCLLLLFMLIFLFSKKSIYNTPYHHRCNVSHCFLDRCGFSTYK